MSRFRRIQHKIRRYKKRLKKLITRIGISSSELFELSEESPKLLILPCYLGILFCGKSNSTLFEKIKSYLDIIFDSFFFEIRNLGVFNFSKEILSKGTKKGYKEGKSSKNSFKIHPTNKFYQLLINMKRKEKLGMIIAITDLPIYSSSNDNIIFLFGEANLKYQCCIVSSLELKEEFHNRPDNQNIFEKRLIKEVVHEVGHLILGPNHCLDKSCVMQFSKEIFEIDNKSANLCNNCIGKLKLIQEEHNF